MVCSMAMPCEECQGWHSKQWVELAFVIHEYLVKGGRKQDHLSDERDFKVLCLRNNIALKYKDNIEGVFHASGQITKLLTRREERQAAEKQRESEAARLAQQPMVEPEQEQDTLPDLMREVKSLKRKIDKVYQQQNKVAEQVAAQGVQLTSIKDLLEKLCKKQKIPIEDVMVVE